VNMVCSASLSIMLRGYRSQSFKPPLSNESQISTSYKATQRPTKMLVVSSDGDHLDSPSYCHQLLKPPFHQSFGLYSSLLAESQEPALLLRLLLGVCFPGDKADVEANADE
jgi:hypothetical protein